MQILKLENSENGSIRVPAGCRSELSLTGEVSAKGIDLTVEEGASLDVYIVMSGAKAGERGYAVEGRLKADARLNVFVACTGSEDISNSIRVSLEGRGAEFSLSGFAIVADGQKTVTSVLVEHLVPHCTSNQLVKYIVGGTGKGVFNGLIRVDYDAVGTRAYQTNRNLLAGPSARMQSEPQLEIYCDDVKCSHGAATGQLDEKALFYMRSRGIGVDEARSMLMNAFVADVIDSVPDDRRREGLKDLVSMRLSKMFNIPTEDADV